MNKQTELINNDIPDITLLVIDEAGTKLGIYPKFKALQVAQEKGMDLVLVNKDAKPAVAKLMDFSKAKFDKSKIKNRSKSKSNVVKEIQLSPTIQKHDMQVKAKSIDKFLSKGNTVRVVLRMPKRMAFGDSTVAKDKFDEFLTYIGEHNLVSRKQEGINIIAYINNKV